MDLNTFVVNPVTLALLILGIVEFVKKFGVAGNKLMLISMFIGIVFAVVYKTRDLYLPAQPYIDVAFFGLAAGLCASGIYSFVNNRFPSQVKTKVTYTKIVRGRGDSVVSSSDASPAVKEDKFPS